MISSSVRIGVIGYGYWGPNLVRNFHELADAEVACVCERRPDRREHLYNHYPLISVVADWRDMLRDDSLDAMVVATPVSTHYELAREILRAGKHVLVEKPLTPGVAQARELIDLAQSRERILMVGHTFVYHGAVRKIRELVCQGELGDLLYLDSTRANLGLIRDDVNVVWDLAPHDISIMDFVLGRPPVAVSATGASHPESRSKDIAFITLHYSDNLIGHVNVSWLSPVKIRKLMIGGTRKMIVFDDNEPSEKVKLYDRGVERSPTTDQRHNRLIQYRSGETVVPKLDLTEALHTEARDFVHSISERRQPLADGESGLRIVQILELACQSLSQGGMPIEVR
jgi:predicted dehydrogenase